MLKYMDVVHSDLLIFAETKVFNKTWATNGIHLILVSIVELEFCGGS